MPSKALTTTKKPRYPLAPWHVGMANYDANEFLPGHGKGPPKEAQCVAASLLANKGRDPALPKVVITYDQIRSLRRRDDYRALVDTIKQGGIEAARATLVNNMPAYMAAHFDALMWAREKKDINGIATLASPVLKAVLPQEIGPSKAVFNITFSDTRERLLTSERPIIEAEIVPPEEPENAL